MPKYPPDALVFRRRRLDYKRMFLFVHDNLSRACPIGSAGWGRI
jgi:hypothetical protein